MSFSPQQNNLDFSQYGFQPEENKKPVVNPPKNSALVAQQPSQPNPTIQQEPQLQESYSTFGFNPIKEKPLKEKAGKGKSILYGLAEGLLGIPSLAQLGVNEWSKSIEKAFYNDEQSPKFSFEEENPILTFLQTFPESEGEGARRFRAGAGAVGAGAFFGIPGIIAGLIGSQAGQTIREVYGNEGKFDEFGLGEGLAIGSDVLAGGVAGALTSLVRGGTGQAARIHAIFQNAETGLQRAIVKNTIQGEKTYLQNIVNQFSQDQVRGFEQHAASLSPDRYTNLINSHTSGLRQHADNMFRNTQLNLISLIVVTPEQGGRALQEAANTIFQSEVIQAERAAYNAARDAAQGVTGTAPRTVEQAKVLRADLLKNNPTSEQQPLIYFLTGLIDDLETTTPASVRPASTILDVFGNPIIAAQEIAESSAPTVRSANDLVDLVQRSNQAVNYGSELRQQSHRLSPIINTLRQEVGTVLRQNQAASTLYQEANQLHGRNAETWGTRFIRNLRFGENPELNIGKLKLSSNMRNFKQAIGDPILQGLGERLVIQQMTEGGTAQSNRNAINRLAPELSMNARNAAQELINVKDPLTTSGGRAAVRNDILNDAAQAVATGKRPEKVLDLMQTPKGYNLVRESLNGTLESRRLFNSFQRLFIEDIFSSITDKTGQIDFNKARNIFKNRDVRDVVESIGGNTLVRRFIQLEEFANSFERNLDLFRSPETQSLFKKLIKETKSAGLIGAILHALHVPLPVITGLGITKALYSGGKVGYKALQSRLLSNPRAVNILESISRANTTQELAKQVPRLLAQFDKEIDDE